jgi:carboxypeptidase C (cathepsin A)
MLWVEYPIGVGFSTGTPTATNEEEPALEFVEFFKNFQVMLLSSLSGWLGLRPISLVGPVLGVLPLA